MSASHIVSEPPAGHEEFVHLLPWYVNGTLAEDEQQRVRAHLGTCLFCRSELNFHRALSRAVRTDDIELNPVNYHFAQLRQRIAGDSPAGAVTAGHISESPATTTGHRRSALVLIALAASVMMVAAGINLFPRQAKQPSLFPAGDFHTLGAATDTASGSRFELFVAFQAGVSDAAVDGLFQELGITPVSRSEARNLWRVRLADQDLGEARIVALLARLRSTDQVLFVERALPSQ